MITRCREIEPLLSAYLENDLPAELTADVTRHLASCPDCRALKERMQELILSLADLQEEVPFFLKNRLFNIPEASEKKKPVRTIVFPKWLAAAAGTIILFLNLSYFTNIFPPLNRTMHSVVGSIETFVVQTGGWFERIKESKDLLALTFFGKKDSATKAEKLSAAFTASKELNKGGNNG